MRWTESLGSGSAGLERPHGAPRCLLSWDQSTGQVGSKGEDRFCVGWTLLLFRELSEWECVLIGCWWLLQSDEVVGWCWLSWGRARGEEELYTNRRR